MFDIENILSEELILLKEEIIRRHEAAGQVASGKTKTEFESNANGRIGSLLGAGYSGVLEKGRKPGPVPRNFVDIIKRWAIAKQITFSTQDDFDRWANAVKWKIIKEGTTLHRSGQTEDIFTTPIEMSVNRIMSRISSSLMEEINNQIFNK